MPLWHFNSDVLKGFYASEVYAIGDTKAKAIDHAGKAFDTWAKAHFDNYGFWPLIDDYFNEAGKAQEQLQEVRKQLIEEAERKFQNMGTAAIFVHS